MLPQIVEQPVGNGAAPTEETTAHRVVLRRDRGNNPGGGVAAGLANYFGIDVVLVRALFLLLAVAGVGVPLYVVLYFLMPQAETGDAVRFPPGSRGQRTARLFAGTVIVALGIGLLVFQLVPVLYWWNALPVAVASAGLLLIVFGVIRR